jgi:hypothetical protein
MDLYKTESKQDKRFPWRVRNRSNWNVLLQLCKTEEEADHYIKVRKEWEIENKRPIETSKQPIYDSADYDTNPH